MVHVLLRHEAVMVAVLCTTLLALLCERIEINEQNIKQGSCIPPGDVLQMLQTAAVCGANLKYCMPPGAAGQGNREASQVPTAMLTVSRQQAKTMLMVIAKQTGRWIWKRSASSMTPSIVRAHFLFITDIRT